MARVAISLPTDEPEDTVTITLVVELDEQLREQIAAAAKQAAAARAAQEAASTASRNVGNAMHDRGLSVRDVGRILSLSPQRVSQLASTTSAAAHH